MIFHSAKRATPVMQEIEPHRSGKDANSFFFVGMFVAIAAIVIYGFSFTVGDNLLHPSYSRPWQVYVHALIAFAWLPFTVLQASLVRLRRVDLHRRFGQWGLIHGAMIPIFGIATAIAMAKVRLAHGEMDAADSLPIPVNDAVGFAVVFSPALIRRTRPDSHRRLMLVAACILTAPGFGRIPALDHAEWFYAGVDALLLIAALRDLGTHGAIHAVYRYALPALLLGQLLTAYVRWTPEWLAIAPQLVR